MKIQGESFSMMRNNYVQMNKEAATANNVRINNKSNKTGNQKNSGISLSSNSQFDKMIEGIQEQIKKIHENDQYDADTKKSKIEELENQLKEIEKIKAEQLKESVLGLNKKTKNNSSDNIAKNDDIKKPNADGVILDISVSAKSLLEAESSLKQMKNANSMKVRLEGESNVLASEIKIDKGRGVDTKKKEEDLDRLKEGVEKSLENIGNAINDINKVAQETSEGTTSTIETSGEIHNDENVKSKEATGNASDNAQTERETQEKTSVNNKKDETNIKNQ